MNPIPKSIYRFAPETVHKRSAIVLQDGRFLEVKPTKTMFANGDAWSASFMGKGATLTAGVNAGKITVDLPPLSTSAKKKTPSLPSPPSLLTLDRQIHGKKTMVANLQARHTALQTEIAETMKKLSELMDADRSVVRMQKWAEGYLKKLQEQKVH